MPDKKGQQLAKREIITIVKRKNNLVETEIPAAHGDVIFYFLSTFLFCIFMY